MISTKEEKNKGREAKRLSRTLVQLNTWCQLLPVQTGADQKVLGEICPGR
jgi:hypothetical protein